MENHSKFSGKVTNVKKNNRGEMRKQIVCLSRSTKINRTLEVLTRRLKEKERKSIQHWKSSHEDKEKRKKKKESMRWLLPAFIEAHFTSDGETTFGVEVLVLRAQLGVTPDLCVD